MTTIENCRICKADVETVMDLGIQTLSGRFPENPTDIIPALPLRLTRCTGECGLVQLSHDVDRNEMYRHYYGYMSGINATMKNHLSQVVAEALDHAGPLKADDCILDIGSNDCTTLKLYSSSNRRYGVDPAGLQFKDLYPADVHLIPDYFGPKILDQIPSKFKIITSIAMFYDLPNPLEFMNCIEQILDLDGVWIMEQSYLPSMISTNSFDTICHEHLEYYCLSQIQYMARLAGLRIVQVRFNDINGGSFRVILRKGAAEPAISEVQQIIDYESHQGYKNRGIYEKFAASCNQQVSKLLECLSSLKRQGKKIWVYGASTKGNVLLQYAGIDTKLIDFAADRNPSKIGRYTPQTLIPIRSEEDMRRENPNAILVLPWHFKAEFVQREQAYSQQGGVMIFPLPIFSTSGRISQPTSLITGMSGQIGTYLREHLLKLGHRVFGTSRIDRNSPDYHRCDLVNLFDVKQVLNDIMPDQVYHLAGESNSNSAIDDPVNTFMANGLSTGVICQAILEVNPKIKLFQALSSELCRGQMMCAITPEFTNFQPKTPYSIAKSEAYWIIRYYREHHKLLAYNAFIFNTESPLRGQQFLTRKIATTLAANNLLIIQGTSSRKDWLHAKDVARACEIILTRGQPGEYVVSSGKTSTIKQLIDYAFDTIGVTVKWNELNDMATDNNGRARVLVKSSQRFYEQDENVIGVDTRLTNLGWVPEISVQDLIGEMIKAELQKLN